MEKSQQIHFVAMRDTERIRYVISRHIESEIEPLVVLVDTLK